MGSLPDNVADAGPLAVLSRFRLDFHACLAARRDEIFELADAVLCADGPVRTLPVLPLAPEHRRGHGALYDAVAHGRISITRLRRVLAGLPLPRAPGGRLTPARVRRGLRNIRATMPCPASAPKSGKPGPGRPPGTRNRRPARRYDVGKTTKRERTLKARRERAG